MSKRKSLKQRRDNLDEWTSGDLIWTGGTICIGLIIAGTVVVGYVSGWDWIGITKPHLRTFWDWLALLGVPLVLALGGYLFNRSENRRAKHQTELDRAVALGNKQDDALQAYLDGISKLLIDNEPPLDEVEKGHHLSTVARALTLTVLETLSVPEMLSVDVRDSGRRKRRVLRFLYESGLIGKENCDAVIDLRRADLSGASLADADLSGASLADADLSGASLVDADLSGADLSGADLSGAHLSGVDLSGANLRDVRKRVKDPMDDKKVTYEVFTNEELANKGPTLKGATMPNGCKYEA